VRCAENDAAQRAALLALKAQLDPGNVLSDWRGDGDYCKWTGVECTAAGDVYML
jgi:hypothetical protein